MGARVPKAIALRCPGCPAVLEGPPWPSVLHDLDPDPSSLIQQHGGHRWKDLSCPLQGSLEPLPLLLLVWVVREGPRSCEARPHLGDALCPGCQVGSGAQERWHWAGQVSSGGVRRAAAAHPALLRPGGPHVCLA